MVLLLVDRPRLAALLERTWDEVDAAMEATQLRPDRPDADNRLVRPFDIDAEAERSTKNSKEPYKKIIV